MAAPAIGRTKLAPALNSRIDWDHPLAEGLVTYVLPQLATDLVTGHRLTVGGTLAMPTYWGNGVGSFTSTKYWKVGDGALVGNRSQFSIFAGVRCSINTAAGGKTIYCERATTGNDICKLVWGDSASALRCVYRDDAGTLINSNGSTTLNVSSEAIVGLVRTSNTVFDTWINGVRDTNFTSGAMTSTFTNANLQRTIGVDVAATSANWDDGAMSFVGVWSRALTANGIAMLQADPYCFLTR